MRFEITRGLDIPIDGAPAQTISDGPAVSRVALLGPDYVGAKPDVLVNEGDRVRLGQALFTDRACPEIRFTAPGSGVVAAINRGERRALRSIVVELAGDEQEEFTTCSPSQLAQLNRTQVVENLLASGLWTAFRTRPFGRVPDPETLPHSILVTAMDSNPLAVRPGVVIDACRTDFEHGLSVIPHLTTGPVFLCTEPEADVPRGDSTRVRVAEFAGRHPSGLPGTHIHFLDPVGEGKTVWHLGYQDVIAIGQLFTSGHLSTERVVALCGPLVDRPRLIRTRLGADTYELVEGETQQGNRRVISGSVLSGHRAAGPLRHLGRYHTQVSVVADARGQSPSGRVERFTTATHGSPGPLIPTPLFDRVMPLDILPTPLLRALLAGDAEQALALGCLELEEEDLALLAFVCPGKHDYAPRLRSVLTLIEKGG